MHVHIAILVDDVPTRCCGQGVGDATKDINVVILATLPYLTHLLVATLLT